MYNDNNSLHIYVDRVINYYIDPKQYQYYHNELCMTVTGTKSVGKRMRTYKP